MKITFTYRGVEFTPEQIRILWYFNEDFMARLRATRQDREWVFVQDSPEVLTLLGLTPPEGRAYAASLRTPR